MVQMSLCLVFGNTVHSPKTSVKLGYLWQGPKVAFNQAAHTYVPDFIDLWIISWEIAQC